MNKLSLTRTALSEAISLDKLHDPKRAVLHELIYTLNDIYLMLNQMRLNIIPGLKEIIDSSDIHQLSKDMKSIHQKLDSHIN